MPIPYPLIFDRASAAELRDDASFWRIYDDAFPADEKEPRTVILRTLSEMKGAVVRARNRSEDDDDLRTVGFAVVHDIPSLRARFLVYLAVARSTRGQGIGARLLREIQALPLPGHGGYGSGTCTLVEVDNPDGIGDERERERRTARIVFFEKSGFRIIVRNYLQPPLGEGKRPVSMFLMAAGSPGAETGKIVRAIYAEKYGGMNGVPHQVLDDLLERSFPV